MPKDPYPGEVPFDGLWNHEVTSPVFIARWLWAKWRRRREATSTAASD